MFLLSSLRLNSIRQISARCPFGMPQYLLSDLIEYKGYRDKGVTIAARSLIQLFREINPELLPKKDRGKEATMSIRKDQHNKIEYGQVKLHDRVAGAEVLDHRMNDLENGGNEDEEELDDGWEILEEDNSESDDEWIDVKSDDQDGDDNGVEIDIDVSDDENSDFSDNENENGLKDSKPITIIPIEQRKILTPQDFADIESSRRKNQLENIVGHKRKSTSTTERY
jgi:protein SDA1